MVQAPGARHAPVLVPWRDNVRGDGAYGTGDGHVLHRPATWHGYGTDRLMAQLGSGVIPVGNGDKPPTNEIGSMSEWALGNVGTWSSLQAYDELETNPKLTFPE